MGIAIPSRTAGAVMSGLALLLPVPGTAQSLLDPGGSPPGVIRVHRGTPKLGHESLAERASGGYAAISDRLGANDYWLAASSSSGRKQLIRIEGFESHLGVQRQVTTLLGLTGFPQATDSVWREVAGHLEEFEVLWAVHRPELGLRPSWAAPDTRALQLITFRVRPGLEADFEAVVKGFVRAYGEAGVDLPWAAYQVTMGMPGPAYLMFIPMTSLEAIDRDLASMASVWQQVPDVPALLAQWARSGESVTTDLFRLMPGMSRVPANFGAGHARFWKR
jgi:hypothetical protein